MIARKDLLAFDFYKKERFTGSCRGMRYLIQKTQEGDENQFTVFVWPGPYNFETTPEESKIKKTFPFTEEALTEIADYLNQVYEERKGDWPERIAV